ncbi:MAG: hypothetical protein RIR77_501, partial [Planctomycetota bacterium]
MSDSPAANSPAPEVPAKTMEQIVA